MLFPHPSASKATSGFLLFTRFLPRRYIGLANTTATLGSFYWLGFETTGLSPDKKRLAWLGAQRKSFSDQISFLSDGRMTVMIPKGAMLHLPAKNRISIQEKIQGKLVEWEEFFRANRNAIRLEPVDADQLQGITPLSPNVLEQISKADLPTLAAYQNRVVSLPAPRQNPQAPAAP